MHDTFAVGGLQTMRGLECDADGPLNRNRSGPNFFLERRALETRHCDKDEFICFLDFIDRTHVLMIDEGDDSRFTDEAFAAGGIVSEEQAAEISARRFAGAASQLRDKRLPFHQLPSVERSGNGIKFVR